MNLVEMPLVFENKIIKQHFSEIVDYINQHKEDFGSLGPDYWQGRTIHMHQIKDKDIFRILKEHKDFLLSEFVKLLGFKDNIYVDTLHLVRWTEGYELRPHADAENPDGSKHQFFWRDFGTVTFLNEDFEGGELYLPKQNLTIKAKAGHSVVFPGTLDYLHGVSKITKGTRYTIASFLTRDKKHEYVV